MRFAIASLLLAAVLIGCGSTTQQILFDAALARAVIEARPPGPKRDQLLAEFDAAIAVGNVALAEQKAQEAIKATAAATQPSK